MDAKGKQARGGIEFTVISALVFLGLDSKPRIPVGENFRILAWIDRDRANIEYFRRRRLGKRRHRETNKRDHKTDFSNRRNHPHKSPFNSSSLLISSLGLLAWMEVKCLSKFVHCFGLSRMVFLRHRAKKEPSIHRFYAQRRVGQPLASGA